MQTHDETGVNCPAHVHPKFANIPQPWVGSSRASAGREPFARELVFGRPASAQTAPRTQSRTIALLGHQARSGRQRPTAPDAVATHRPTGRSGAAAARPSTSPRRCASAKLADACRGHRDGVASGDPCPGRASAERLHSRCSTAATGGSLRQQRVGMLSSSPRRPAIQTAPSPMAAIV